MFDRCADEILANLPKHCALQDSVTGNTILVKRGEIGYWPAPLIDAESFNSGKGITPAQVEAMRMGSVFGFNLPIADPLNHSDAKDMK